MEIIIKYTFDEKENKNKEQKKKKKRILWICGYEVRYNKVTVYVRFGYGHDLA